MKPSHRNVLPSLLLIVLIIGCGACAKKLPTGPTSETMITHEKGRISHTTDIHAAKMAGMGKMAKPSASGLKAAFADDNRQFNRYLEFLEKHKDIPHRKADVTERLTFAVTDQEGLVLPDCTVTISIGGDVVERGTTTADGTFATFPRLYARRAAQMSVRISGHGAETTLTVQRQGKRRISVILNTQRVLPQAIPLDLLFALDTTGSMGEEIQRLKTSIDLINMNLSEHSARPFIRYGMVLYKDRGDEYLTKVIPFTPELEDFREELNRITAEGGGDTPEDLESALYQATEEMAWSPKGVRLAFVITDAPPQLHPETDFTYLDAARVARQKGIKLFSVGTGGLTVDGEMALRQISQLTGGAYIFLTYGERGESDGGQPGSVSHHTGTNFTSDKLEAVIIKIARNELAHLTGESHNDGGYFEATPGKEAPEAILDDLFKQAVGQLADYASISLAHKPATAILPVASNLTASDAGHLTSSLLLAATKHPLFTVVDRENTGAIVKEITLGLSGTVDEETAAEAGHLTGASILMAASAQRAGNRVNILIRLVAVETGEVLSVTRLVLDPQLLPSHW